MPIRVNAAAWGGAGGGGSRFRVFSPFLIVDPLGISWLPASRSHQHLWIESFVHRRWAVIQPGHVAENDFLWFVWEGLLQCRYGMIPCKRPETLGPSLALCGNSGVPPSAAVYNGNPLTPPCINTGQVPKVVVLRGPGASTIPYLVLISQANNTAICTIPIGPERRDTMLQIAASVIAANRGKIFVYLIYTHGCALGSFFALEQQEYGNAFPPCCCERNRGSRREI